jgi:DNA-binding CsgD family transcriptional regulator
VDTRPAGLPLTAREREVSRLIGGGLTNRQIASRLSISERTVGAHVQNILNKLGANNRAQIAVWSMQTSLNQGAPGSPRKQPETTIAAPTVATRRQTRQRILGLVSWGAVAVFLFTSDGGVGQSAASRSAPSARDGLVYEAKLTSDGEGFTVRTVIGDPSASAIRFGNGIVEYAVIKPGGNTGNRLAMAPMTRFFVEIELAVVPDSDVQFWLTLTAHANGHIQHLVSVSTRAEEFQLAYFAEPDTEYLGSQVPVPGLQRGRQFELSALVDPPHYRVYLDGQSVINLQNEAEAAYRVPGFAIFGDGTGTVRLSAVRVFSLN